MQGEVAEEEDDNKQGVTGDSQVGLHSQPCVGTEMNQEIYIAIKAFCCMMLMKFLGLLNLAFDNKTN